MAMRKVVEEDEGPLMSPAELAAKLGVRVNWVYGRLGELPHVRLGKYVRFARRDIDRWLASQRRQGGA
jgi:excisionase family DNA binding protein